MSDQHKPAASLTGASGADNEIDLTNPEFNTLLSVLDHTDRSVFLTGKAGTGKSTFVRYITSHTRKKFVVLAPTGIAAVNAGGQTLHSFFKIPFKPLLPDDPEFAESRLRSRMKYSSRHVKLIKALELIIIDEISMVRADIIDFIDKVLRVITGNRRKPFGGKQLLLVGDVFQLEPVVTPDMRSILSNTYRQPFFFNALAFSSLSLISIELRKVYRQSDPEFVGMLDRVRCGRPLQSDIDTLNARVRNTDSAADSRQGLTMTIATRRDIVDNINESRLDRLPTELCTFEGDIAGDFPENSLPTDRSLVLKEGAQVVFIKNDFDHRWVNGTIGTVTDCSCADVIIVELENGERVEVVRERWANIRYEYNARKKSVEEIELGSFTQFPLKLAWALTIHKSQGLTFNSVVIDVGTGAFTGGQSYVALSRCRSLEGITLRSTINPRDIFVNRSVLEFASTFNDTAVVDSAITAAKADRCYELAARAMDSGDTSQAARLFAEAVSLKPLPDSAAVARLIAVKLSVVGRQRKEIEQLREQIDSDRQRLRRMAEQYYLMGEECRLEIGDPLPAIGNYDKALELYPGYRAALLGKARALAMADDVAAAAETLRDGGALHSDDPEFPLLRGRLMFDARMYAEALDGALAALAITDDEPRCHDLCADVYEAIGSEDEAEAHRLKARRLRGK